MNLAAAILVVVVMQATWWYVLHRTVLKSGVDACVSALDKLGILFVFFFVGSIPLAMLSAFLGFVNRSESFLGEFLFASVASVSLIFVGALLTFVPLAVQLNSAVLQTFDRRASPNFDAIGALLWLRRTRWIQSPLFRMHGASYLQIQEWLSNASSDENNHTRSIP